MPNAAAALDYASLISEARLELEAAGNPAYAVAVVDAGAATHLSPMVFSTVGPAAAHAKRVIDSAGEGERVVIVSRSAAERRAMFTVVEPRSLKKLHQRLEVIEETFAEIDRAL